MFVGIILKLKSIQGTKNIKAITNGNRTVQQKDINWSNLILGKEALTHIKIKISIFVFIPKIKLYKTPSIKGLSI